MNQKKQVDKAQAVEQLWRRGQLSWLLDSNQQSLYKLFHESKFDLQTWLLARRSGKTFALCVIAIEQCLRHPRSIVKFLSPSKKQVERNIRPLMSQILETCPEELKPELKLKDDIYYFSNGSEIQMAGSEMGNIDSLRGGFSNICMIDEAQDVSNLKYAINSVLGPTTLTTKGKILLVGTPPTSYDHEFINYIEEADLEGSLIRRNIYENPRLTEADIERQIKLVGGIQTEEWKREFLCEIIKDSTTSIIPEFTEEKAKELVKVWPKPIFYHPITSMDLGLRDWTFVLFGYFDFRADKLIIEDEIVTNGADMYLNKLGTDILVKEKELWVDNITKENIPVKKRVSDHDLIAINEIKKNTNYQVIFDTADKHDKMVGINFIRTMINNNKLIINPKCKYLIHHLKNGKWAKSRELFARCAQGSHYDGIHALVYLSRAINYSLNPYPANYGSELKIADTFQYKKPSEGYVNEFGNVVNYGTKNNKDHDIYKRILNINNKKNRKDGANELLVSRNDTIKKYYK